MPRRRGDPYERRDSARYVGELSRIVVICTSVLATVVAVALLILVLLTFVGVA